METKSHTLPTFTLPKFFQNSKFLKISPKIPNFQTFFKISRENLHKKPTPPLPSPLKMPVTNKNTKNPPTTAAVLVLYYHPDSYGSQKVSLSLTFFPT